jgi:hypothetical protein
MPNSDDLCTNPAANTQEGCRVSGVCYDAENIATPLARTSQTCASTGVGCVAGHIGRGCVSYLSKDECRVGGNHALDRYLNHQLVGFDVYGHMYSTPAYPFRQVVQQVRSTHNPCICDEDGIVDGVDTGRAGCAVHVSGVAAFCMVSLDCPTLAGVSSTFVGVAYRWCNPGELSANAEKQVPLNWTAFSWSSPNRWNESITVTNATMASDDHQPNRDHEAFGSILAAINGGDQFVRYRTKISPGYTVELTLASPSTVEGVSILVHADQGTVATGHSGISLAVSNNGGVSYHLVHQASFMYGAYERSATYMTVAPGFGFDQWTSHTFEAQVNVTHVKLHFGRADQAGDSAFSLHSIRVDGPGSPSDIRCSNPVYHTYENCRAASGVCSNPKFLTMHECEMHGSCCATQGCVTQSEQFQEEHTSVQILQRFLPNGNHVFQSIPQVMSAHLVPLTASECINGTWDWSPFSWKQDSWNVKRSVCQGCRPDQYSSDGAQCRRCDAGYQISNDQASCVVCPQGWFSSTTADAWMINLEKRLFARTFRRPALNVDSDVIEFQFFTPMDLSQDIAIRMTVAAIPSVSISLDVVDFVGRRTGVLVSRTISPGFATTDFVFVGVGSCTDGAGRQVNASDQLECEEVRTGNSWRPFVPSSCLSPAGQHAGWSAVDRESCETMSSGLRWQPEILASCKDSGGNLITARAHQSKTGCVSATHSTGNVWADAVAESCTDSNGRKLQNVTILVHGLDGNTFHKSFAVVDQTECTRAVRQYFGHRSIAVHSAAACGSRDVFTPAACRDSSGLTVQAASKDACELTGNTFSPSNCTGGGDASSQEACELTGNRFTDAACVDGNGNSVDNLAGSRVLCEVNGNTYVRANCTNGGNAASRVTCERTTKTFTMRTCTGGGNASSLELCERTGNTFSPATCIGPTVLEPFSKFGLQHNCSTICTVGRKVPNWMLGEGWCTDNQMVTTGATDRVSCEGPPDSPTGNTWNAISETGCKIDSGGSGPDILVEGADNEWDCEMFYTGNTWKPFEPEFCQSPQRTNLVPTPPDRSTCEVGVHSTGYIWTDTVKEGCLNAANQYTSIGIDRLSCEVFPTGYKWSSAIPAACISQTGQPVQFVTDGAGNAIIASAESCEVVATGNKWNLDARKIDKMLFTANPTGAGWEGHMMVLKMAQRNTDVNLLSRGSWHPAHAAELVPADEFSGIQCERCTPGKEPDLTAAATGCVSCKQRGPGFYNSDGIECIECPAGHQPASSPGPFIDGVRSLLEDATCVQCQARFAGQRGICERCPSGTEPSSDHTSCVSCTSGFAGVAGECHRCANGTESSAANTSCVPCRAGYAGVFGVCVRCDAGHEPSGDRTSCSQCKAQADPGTTNCVDDPSFRNSYGEDCASYTEGVLTAGHENHALCKQDGADLLCQVSCKTCPAEEYSPSGIACLRCDRGYSVNANQSACDPCPSGRFGIDGRTCAQCLGGEEPTSSQAATECKPCKLKGVAYYSDGGAACAICPAGTQPIENRTRCQTCPVGKLRTQQDPGILCTGCPDGKTTSAKVGGECIYCRAGQAGLNGQCDACSPGRFPSPGRTACLSCPVGRYSLDGRRCAVCSQGREPNPGKTGCVDCPRGHIELNSECSRCAASTKPNLEMTQCTPCPTSGIGVDGICSQCDAIGYSLAGQSFVEIPNINISDLPQRYGRVSDVGGSCTDRDGAPVWEFVANTSCEEARVDGGFTWTQAVAGYCIDSGGVRFPELSDQVSCIASGKIWIPLVPGFCSDRRGERVASPRDACEIAVVLARNVWSPPLNTACEPRVEVYCRQYALDLAAKEKTELEKKLEENSVAAQLWRAVPGFVLVCGGVAVGLFVGLLAVTELRRCRAQSSPASSAFQDAITNMWRDLLRALCQLGKRGKKLVSFSSAKSKYAIEDYQGTSSRKGTKLSIKDDEASPSTELAAPAAATAKPPQGPAYQEAEAEAEPTMRLLEDDSTASTALALVDAPSAQVPPSGKDSEPVAPSPEPEAGSGSGSGSESVSTSDSDSESDEDEDEDEPAPEPEVEPEAEPEPEPEKKMFSWEVSAPDPVADEATAEQERRTSTLRQIYSVLSRPKLWR